LTGTIGCALENGEESGVPKAEQTGAVAQAIRGGDSLNPTARPYEELIVGVSGCSGALVPHSDLVARYAITARHCVDGGVVPTNVRIGRGSDNTFLSRGKAIHFHPDTFVEGNDDIDVALVELETPLNVTTRMFFSTLTPTELEGSTARCYGGGGVAGFTQLTAGFTIIRTDSAGNPAIHFDVREPNALGQEIIGGDSGGACVRTTGTTSATLYGIVKSSGSTRSRMMASVSFTEWVRTFIPR
jgi:hypothetical protein